MVRLALLCGKACLAASAELCELRSELRGERSERSSTTAFALQAGLISSYLSGEASEKRSREGRVAAEARMVATDEDGTTVDKLGRKASLSRSVGRGWDNLFMWFMWLWARMLRDPLSPMRPPPSLGAAPGPAVLAPLRAPGSL